MSRKTEQIIANLSADETAEMLRECLAEMGCTEDDDDYIGGLRRVVRRYAEIMKGIAKLPRVNHETYASSNGNGCDGMVGDSDGRYIEFDDLADLIASTKESGS